jgi:hypothetical protein
MNGTKENLKKLVELSGIVKSWTNGMVSVARLLIPEDEAHELQDLARESGSNLATIEGNLAELSRLTPFSKKFVAKQKS